MGMALFHKMIPVAAVLAGLAVLDMLRPNLDSHAVLSLVITATGALWVTVGVWRYVPGRVGLLLLAAATLNLAAMVVWLAPVLAGGDAPLAQPSIADAGWLIGSPLLAAAMLYALTRRESPRFVVLDVVTLAVAIGVVAGVAVIGPDFGASTAPLELRITQACYVVVDIFLASVVLRVLLAPRGRPAALWFLAAAGAGLVVSDFAWTWLAISGTYVAGSWADVGFLAQPLLLGLAVLHPSVRRLGVAEARHDVELRTSGIALLAIALLVAPLLRSGHHFFPAFLDMDDALWTSVAMVGSGSLLAALVVLRFVLLLRRARRLAAVTGVVLDDRTRLLSESQSRYRSLVEQLPAITVVFTLREDGSVQPTYVSPQASVILGVEASVWLADFDSILRRVHPDDLPRMVQALAAVAAGTPMRADRVPGHARRRRRDLAQRRRRRADGGLLRSPHPDDAVRHQRRQARAGRARGDGAGAAARPEARGGRRARRRHRARDQHADPVRRRHCARSCAMPSRT